MPISRYTRRTNIWRRTWMPRFRGKSWKSCGALRARVGRLQHLAAIEGLRAAPQMRLKSIVQASGWRSRSAIAAALAVPPVQYLEAKYSTRGAVPVALLYFTRPLRFAGRQLNKIQRRVRRRWFKSDPVEARRAFVARLRPQERLLLGCIRSEMDDATAQQIAHDLQGKTINWALVLQTAQRQGISPLLSRHLNKLTRAGADRSGRGFEKLPRGHVQCDSDARDTCPAATRGSGVHESQSTHRYAHQGGGP